MSTSTSYVGTTFDRPSEAIAENVMEEAITVAKVTEKATLITPTYSTPNEQ